MRLEAIDLSALEDRSRPNRWGAGQWDDRRLFFESKRAFWYKIWSNKYIRELKHVRHGKYELVQQDNNSLPGFDLGIFDSSIASAFVDFVWDDVGDLRGYVTRDGACPPERNVAGGGVPSSFAKLCFDRMIATGWISTDFCAANVAIVDGKPSLIDFDTALTDVSALDMDFERENGSLRPHVDKHFAELISAFIARAD
jgi:hypothetical protein